MDLTPTIALDFSKTVLRAGRNEGPALLHDWWYGGRLSRDDLRRVITDVWEMAEFPGSYLRQVTWIELFREVGFVSDDDTPVPTEPMRVYRGTTWGRRRGMSWTTDRAVAEWFAGRWKLTDHDAAVCSAVVEPGAMLAFIGMEDGRNEHELVVDPSMLPPIKASDRTG